MNQQKNGMDYSLNYLDAVNDSIEDFIYICKWGLSSNRQILDFTKKLHARFMVWRKWFFSEDRDKRILSRVYTEYSKGVKKLKRHRIDDVDWTLISSLTQDWEYRVRSDEEFNDIWMEGLKTGYDTGGKAFLGRLGIRASFNLRDPGVITQLKNRVNLMRKDIDDFTFNRIKGVILDSYYNKGEHPFATARRIHMEFQDIERARAKTIARTETNWAMSNANLESMKRADIQYKKWLTTRGACEECAPLNREVVPVEGAFSNGWQSPADAHPNCRCAISPSMIRGTAPVQYWNGESMENIED